MTGRSAARSLLLVLLAALATTGCSCDAPENASESGASAPETSTVVEPQIDARLVTRWMMRLVNRNPGGSTSGLHRLGRGALMIDVPEASQGWFEMADLDSNRTSEHLTVMWDLRNKTLFAWTPDSVLRADRTFARNGLLVAEFLEGNSSKRPPGSGWYAYARTADTLNLDPGSGSLYGCRFDSLGIAEDCGTRILVRRGTELFLRAQGR